MNCEHLYAVPQIEIESARLATAPAPPRTRSSIYLPKLDLDIEFCYKFGRDTDNT